MRKRSPSAVSKVLSLHALLIWGWLGLGAKAVPPEATPIPHSPLNRQLDSLVLPQVRFRDIDFLGALKYFRGKAGQQSEGKIQVPFIVDLPKDFRPQSELTLDLHSVPYREALRYLGELAGVQFSITPEAVIVRQGESASAKKAQAQENAMPGTTPLPKGLTGPLGKPAESAASGNNVHRATSGEIQPEKSRYVRNRSLSGWSTTTDPGSRRDVNCRHLSPCPSGTCGCGICCCLTH